jgi:predicted nuclease of predicted toxin-antitoxin system
MKFLADMGISPRSAAFLCRQGHDAIHLHDAGLDRLSDANILSKALDEGRVVLTHDLDFGDLVAASGARLPSVVTFRLRNMSADHVNRYLQLILADYQERLIAGAVISVTEGQIRVRSLPIGASPS